MAASMRRSEYDHVQTLSGMVKAVRGIGRATRYAWVVGLALIVVTMLGCAAAIWNLHQQAIDQQRVAVTNLSVVLAEQTNRYLQVVDLVLQEMQAHVVREHAHGLDDQSSETDPSHAFLRNRLTGLPQANAFILIRPDGHMFASSRAELRSDLDFSDRDYYRHFIKHDDDGPFISVPTTSRVTGTPTMYLARRIQSADGALLGLAVGAIDLQYWTEFYRAIELPPGEAVTLLRRDGVVLARYPDPTHEVGHSMPASSPWYGLVAGQGGTYRSPGFLGPTRAIVSVRPLHLWPLVIDVSMREPEALAKWWGQATIISIGGVGLSCGFAVLFGVIGQQFRRKAERAVQLTKTAEALRASEQRVLDFARMSTDFLWEVDAELHFIWVSDSPMVHAMGIPEQMGMTPWDALGADVTGAHWVWLRDQMQARHPFRDFRDEEVDAFGGHHIVSINGNPVFDAGATFVGYRGTGRDVTSDVMAARELELAKERAETATRAKSEFLANMSHELRTPLNAIIGFSELIRDQPFDRIAANYTCYATDINTAGHDLLDMINDVLDLSKIEAGKYQLADDTVGLAMVVRSCVALLRLRAKEGGVRIENQVNGDRVTLRGDGPAVKQIVLNLLGNAVKFTPKDGLVVLSIEHTDAGVALVFADTGIGIEAAVAASLGQPFCQADASISRKFGGTGLGLAICRKLLDLHGGSLTIDSTPGLGTTVRAAFPHQRIIDTLHSTAPTMPEPALSA
jgi:signal transduction histidine kinase